MTAAVPVRPDPRNCKPIVQVIVARYPPHVARGRRGYWLPIWRTWDLVTREAGTMVWAARPLSPN